MIVVTLEGLAEALGKLDRATLGNVTASALKKFANEIKLRAVIYPPEGPWCAPGPYPHRWYQRHFGPRWSRKDGTIGGRNTSERMQLGWVVEPRSQVEVVVGNRASYSPYVVGAEQTAVHAAHGWKRVDKIAEEQYPLWTEIFGHEFAQACGGD